MSWLTDLLARRHRSSTREYHVVLPDGTERTFDLARTATGHDLVEVSLLSMSVPGVYHFMFGLTIPSKDDHDHRKWIRLEKALRKEIKTYPVSLYIQVLLYPKAPTLIDHKIVQHLLYRQVCSDLKEGKIQCSETVCVELAGLMAQAELGDYSESMLGNSYMAQMNFVYMNSRHECQAIEQHKMKSGLKPDDCMNEFLSIAETLDGYGSVLFNTQDSHGHAALLSCGPKGIDVLIGNVQVLMLPWESIRVINIRHRVINFRVDNSYSVASHSFRCGSAKRCKQISLQCVLMRNHYCNSEVKQPPSRLRRFLSTRLTNRKKQSSSSLQRNLSALSSISAPARYHHNDHASANSRVSSRPIAHINDDSVMCHTAPHTRASSTSSSTTGLLTLDTINSPSLVDALTVPITVLPTLEEKEPPLPQIAPLVPPPKERAATLPARLNNTGAFSQDSYLQQGELKYLTTNTELEVEDIQRYDNDNLNCINELIEEGLETYNHKSDFRTSTRQNGKVHPEKKYRRRSDRGVHYTDEMKNSFAYRSMTMQHTKRYSERSLNSRHSNNHYHQQSDPYHYHSATNLYRASSNSRVNEGVVTMAHQLSIATLSQDSTYIDPHIRSLVYESSQADTETEL